MNHRASSPQNSAQTSPTQSHKSELLNQVSKLVQKIKEASPTDANASAVFYTYITTNILPLAESSDCPPITILTYVVSNILQPTIAYSLIPALLDIFAHINHIRQKVVATAQDILEKSERGEISLPKGKEGQDKTKKMLKNYASAKYDAEHRSSYRTLVNKLCQQHIYHVRATRTDLYMLPVLMKEYFPSPYTKETDEYAVNSDQFWTSLRHSDLSIDERTELHNSGEESKAFLRKARKWEQERAEYFAKIGLADKIYEENEFLSYQRDFRAKFQSSAKEGELVELVLWFVNLVQNRVEVLEELFPRMARTEE